MTPQEFTQFMTLLCGQTETPHEAAFYPHMAMSKPKMAYWYKELHSFPLAVCCTALERYYDTGEDERLLGVGFLLTPCVMKPCAYLRHSLPPPRCGWPQAAFGSGSETSASGARRVGQDSGMKRP
jgi:hypothetical protein